MVQKRSRKKETRNRPVNQNVTGAVCKNRPPVAFKLHHIEPEEAVSLLAQLAVQIAGHFT